MTLSAWRVVRDEHISTICEAFINIRILGKWLTETRRNPYNLIADKFLYKTTYILLSTTLISLMVGIYSQ